MSNLTPRQPRLLSLDMAAGLLGADSATAQVTAIEAGRLVDPETATVAVNPQRLRIFNCDRDRGLPGRLPSAGHRDAAAERFLPQEHLTVASH